MKFYWDPKEQSTQTTSCQHTLSKKNTLVQHIGEVRSCYNRDKTYVPVFYRGNKLCVLVLVRVIKSYEQELVPIIYYRDKTRVHMFYFLTTSTTIIITITATTKTIRVV